MLNFFTLLGLYVQVKYRDLLELFKVAKRYYHKRQFLWLDLGMLRNYYLISADATSKCYLRRKGAENIHIYGTTYLTSLDSICKRCNITASDTVFELGCGPGRTCFWLNCFYKCKVIGLEHIPRFVKIANKLKQQMKFKDVEFRDDDMLVADYTEASVVYLYGTCLSNAEIKQLSKSLQTLKAGSKIISVSYPLVDLLPKGFLYLEHCFPVAYPWGSADVYLQVVS